MSGRGRRGVQGLLIVAAALVVMSYFAFARERPSGASRGAGLPLRQPSKAEIEASELASAQRCNLHNHPSGSTTLKLPQKQIVGSIPAAASTPELKYQP
ncbi:hypothetical protein DIPPA_34547 [Diplonema papillatum]|nr:hypothetical protein DIPPA_34547 [Diplonema papillatum]